MRATSTPFPRTFLPLSLLVLLAVQAPAHPQDRQADPQRAIERFEQFLAKKPYHDWAFDKLVETVVAINGLADLVENYEGLVAESASDEAARIVLARLYAKTEQHEEALAALDAIEDKDASLYRLVGTLELHRNRTAEAIQALNRAAELAQERELLEAIHELRGEAFLALGERTKAHEAFHALAELEPQSFPLRLEAASTLAFHGLHEEALEEFAVADKLAGNDTARRCRVLAEIGKLHEALSQGQEALVVYREAIGLMARGNWLKRDLYERVLALHTRTGLMDQLLESAQADAQANAQDLDAREFQARVLETLGRHEEARDVLVAATAEFPGDLKLSRRMIEVFTDLEDSDAVIAEYQRILAEKPDELELYLELGQVFASAGRFEQAKRQWAKTLESRLTDPGLCVRLAGLYALYDQPEDAVAMYEKAIELEPGELRHFADLAGFLGSRDRKDEVPALLERATGAAAGNAGRLEELSGLWREHGDLERARVAIEAALELKTDNPHLLHRLADLLIAEGEIERATDVLHLVINLARESNLRRTAVDRLLRIFYRADRADELIALEEAAIEGGTREVAPYLVLGKAWMQRREPDRAIHYLELLLEIDTESEDARLSLARLHEQQGDWDVALEQYTALMETRPQSRRKYLQAVAKIHLSRYDQDAAFACYEEILAGAPDNPAAFIEVGEAYRRLGLMDESSECLRQALRLKPEDTRTRLKLADLYRQMGEVERAEREILAAVNGPDDNLRETARKRYYELISDGGRVNEEIASLRTRIDENPYDVAAPLTLTDIYVRELEYELALDMLQKLLTYQPNEARLLSERARMLGLMDRWDEAILDYERLWKLPDADQNALALDIAGAALEQGDRERAAQVLSQVNDVQKVAGLYRRKELWDEAIETLESGLTRSPGDFRLLSSLSRLYASRGDEDGAIEVLERALELRGDSWKLILRLGQLYHDVGRREDAIELGQQLFALIRVEEEDEDEDEDETEANRSASAFRLRSARNWNRSRVSEIQSYFQGKGLSSEFAKIGRKEVLLQPTNHDLFTIVLSALQREDGKGAQALELIEAVGTATLEKNRIPTGQTARTWQRSLAQNRVNIYRRDVPFAEERATQLGSELEGGSATPESLIELARVELYLTHKAEMLEVLEQGVQLFPDSTNLLAGLAQSLVLEKRYEEALPHFERLIDMLGERGEDPQDVADEAFQREFAFKSGKQGVLQGFPIHVRRRVSDADVRRFMDLTRYRSLYLSWGPGVVQKLDGARVSYAQCLGKADRKPEASAILAELANDESNTLTDLSSIAAQYFQLDLFEEALTIYELLIERDRELSADPLFGFNRSWASRFTRGMGNLARIHEKRGDPVLAYDILRTYGDADAGQLILSSNDAMGAAQANYEARVASEEERLDSAAEGEEVDSDAWRDACVRLAELHQMQKHWDETLAVYERIAERRPDDFAVLQTIATLHERAGRWEDAVTTHYRIIDKKRVLNRTPYRPAHPPGRVLTPKPPALPQEDNNWAWQNLQNNFRYFRGAGIGAQRFSYRDNYVAILKLHMDRGEVSKAAEVMRDLARSDAQTFGWLGSSLANIMQQYRFGEAGIPILRMVYMQNPTYEHLNLQYGQALVAAKKVDEARRVLTKLSDSSSSNSYYKDQAQALLSTLDAREGIDTREGLADLRSAVEADPKSVKKRTKLARRLLSDRDFEGALEHARIAEQLAPHKDDVKALTQDCLQVTGREQELEQRLIESLDDIKNERLRIEAAARVANWMWARGDREAVDGVFELATRRMSRGYPTYTSAGWYIQKGALDKAVAVMRKDLETTEKNRQTQIRQSLAAVEVALGNPMGLLDEAWEEYYLKASAQGAKSQALTRLATVLRGLPGLDELQEELVATCLERDGLQGVLYAAAVEMAAGDLEACEERLTELAEPDGDTRFLYPVLVTLARARDDLPRALELLQELQELGVASQSNNVQTTVGYLSEADALRAEIGSLHLALGDKDQALAVWEEMFDPDDDQGLKRKATLYGWHDLLDEAADMQRRYLDEVGERSESDLDFLADLESRRGDHDAAIELWKKALILAGTQNEYQAQQYRSKLLDAYRAAGRLQDFVAELEARCEADPDDFEARKHLVRLYGEASEEERALELLNGMLERPGMANSVLPTMIQRALLRGDEEQAIAWSRRLLKENMDEYKRQREAKRLGTLLIRRGQVDEGVQVILDGNLDSDGAQAHDQAAAVLTAEQLHEQALEQYDRARKLDPENWYRKRSIIRTLVSLGRHSEARDRILEFLADPKGRQQASNLLAQYSGLLDETDERERVAAVLASEAIDPTTLLCAAQIAIQDDDTETAIAHYEALLAKDPEDGLVLQLLWTQYKKAERYSDAVAVIERLLPLVDRETGVGGLDRDYYGNARGLRQTRAELLLRDGDLAAAEAAVQDQLGRRYDRVQGYYYRYGSFQSSPPSDLITLHRNLENWERCLELYREHPQVAAPGNRQRDSSLYEVRFRAGERKQVLEDLWRTVYDPAASLFQSQRYMTFYGNPQNLIRSNEPMGILVRLHRENGTMDELVQRVEAAVKRDPHLTQLVDFRRLLLAAEDRWELLLPYRQEQLEKMPYDPQVQYEAAKLYRRLGRDEEAIALLESARDLYRGQSFGQVVGWTYHERMNPYGQKGPVRFSFTKGSSGIYFGGSGWTTYGISTAGWGGPEDAVRRELAALYLRSGRREEALILEQREDAGRRVQDLQGYRASDSLVSLYQEFELWEDAERRALVALEENLAEIDEPDEEKALHARERVEGRAWASLARMWGEAGDETRQHDYAERRMQLYAAAMERATEGISSLLASRAGFRAETLGDLDGARADLERYLEERESEKPLVSRSVAWTWYRIGEHERAREIFQAADREQRLNGTVFNADLWIGLALCAAAAGEEISETDLRRALAGSPEHDFTDEARALLE